MHLFCNDNTSLLHLIVTFFLITCFGHKVANTTDVKSFSILSEKHTISAYGHIWDQIQRLKQGYRAQSKLIHNCWHCSDWSFDNVGHQKVFWKLSQLLYEMEGYEFVHKILFK